MDKFLNNNLITNDKFYSQLNDKLIKEGVKVEELKNIEISNDVIGIKVNIVYRGKYKGKNVAVKALTRKVVQNRADDFVREVSLQTKLSHERIPKVHCVAFSEKNVYVVIDEITKCTTLDKKCKDVDYKQKINYFIQLVTIVDQLHKINIIHRDLNPSDILISDKNIVYLTNFGLSKDITSGTATATIDSKGTIKYMPPECFIFDEEYSDDEGDQAVNLNITLNMDIWALGCIMSECLTNISPWSNLDWDSFDYKALDIKKKTVINDIVITEILVSQEVPFPLPEEIKQPMRGIILCCVEQIKEKRINTGSLLKRLNEHYTKL